MEDRIRITIKGRSVVVKKQDFPPVRDIGPPHKTSRFIALESFVEAVEALKKDGESKDRFLESLDAPPAFGSQKKRARRS